MKSFFMSLTPILSYEAKALMGDLYYLFLSNFLVSFDITDSASL